MATACHELNHHVNRCDEVVNEVRPAAMVAERHWSRFLLAIHTSDTYPDVIPRNNLASSPMLWMSSSMKMSHPILWRTWAALPTNSSEWQT